MRRRNDLVPLEAVTELLDVARRLFEAGAKTQKDAIDAALAPVPFVLPPKLTPEDEARLRKAQNRAGTIEVDKILEGVDGPEVAKWRKSGTSRET